MYFKPTDIESIASQIKSGKIGVFPCDTILGLVGLATERNCSRIQSIKQRQSTPFIVLVSNISQVKQLSSSLSQKNDQLLTQYWPGPITFILEKSESLPPILTAGKDSIGLRQTDFLPLNYLLRCIDAPIISTSVNSHGQKAALTKEAIPADILEQLDFCYTATIADSSQASTVVDLTQDLPKILRQGDLHFEIN